MAKIFPLGETALTIELSNEISPETNDKIIALANYFDANKFSGLIETVPAYASLTIFYDVLKVRKNFGEFDTAFAAVKFLAEKAIQSSVEFGSNALRTIEIAVNFGAECALDLQFVAESNGLTPGEAIEFFCKPIYRVYMLGFTPGFAYMGEIDERIAAPRKKAPRLKVPPGSVGIAGRQTGIYPFASPGGWQIIGKTDLALFDPKSENPTFLRAGNRVKFYNAADFR